jgi:CHAD domain-containing protein
MATAFEAAGLDPQAPLHECLRRITSARIGEIVSYSQGALEGGIEAIHDMRVACRRLQTVLIIFKDFYKKNKLRAFKKRLRELMRGLGKVRECDVAIETLTELIVPSDTSQLPARNMLLAGYAARRDAHIAQLTGLLLDLKKKPSFELFIDSAKSGASPTFERTARMGNGLGFPALMRDALGAMADDFMSSAEIAIDGQAAMDALHELRIKGKPLRYALELAKAYLPPAFGVYVKKVKKIIETLGTIHDLEVARSGLQSTISEIDFYNRAAVKDHIGLLPFECLREAQERLERETAALIDKVSTNLRTWRRKDFGKSLKSFLRAAQWTSSIKTRRRPAPSASVMAGVPEKEKQEPLNAPKINFR